MQYGAKSTSDATVQPIAKRIFFDEGRPKASSPNPMTSATPMG